jgi:ATP-dependent helicase/nuclease subunit A
MSSSFSSSSSALARTIALQREASDPVVSAWVSANAGSGKTRVLTDRVLRLLLSGTRPHQILCLTFTRAAAAEMALRVFDTLGRWVTLGDTALEETLRELEGRAPDRLRLKRARRLFARAVETPGGLKIETIHAFCQRLLNSAPLEAGVPVRFSVLEEADARALREEAIAATLREAQNDPSLSQALERLVQDGAGDTLSALLGEALSCHEFWERFSDHPSLHEQRLRTALSLDTGDSEEKLLAQMLTEAPAQDLRNAVPVLLRGQQTDQEHGALLARIFEAEPCVSPAGARLYQRLYLTKDGGPRKKLATKVIPAGILALLQAEQERIVALSQRLKACSALARSQALMILAAHVRTYEEETRRRRAVLDFDDLIDRTLTLLRRGEGDAAWVLYKLDRGIDHVLIDEAQDTNARQWEIIRRITQDFTAGEGARAGTRKQDMSRAPETKGLSVAVSLQDMPRTLFAVGDPKQSIYSFQGAQPQEFALSRRFFASRYRAAGIGWRDVTLTLSFRSGRAVLGAVDQVFAHPRHYHGLSFEEGAIGTVHESIRPQERGRFELWPVEEPQEVPSRDPFAEPGDRGFEAPPPLRAARKVARAIAEGIKNGEFSPDEVIVLARKRDGGFEAAIRALKEQDLPVAGADRLDIAAHIAVQDLVACAACALLPHDDLTLAAALKSPLLGFSEEDLQYVALGRPESESLFQALHRHAPLYPAAARVCLRVQSWRNLAHTHQAFGFFSTLLGPMGGRKMLRAQLGPEAGDAIDAFLALVLEQERLQVPSLSGFLERFRQSSHEIRRESGTVREDIRVMTVHGAKGLEAKAIFVLDGGSVTGKGKQILPLGDCLVWSPSAKTDPAPCLALREHQQDEALQEHNRLLYVAMTRAKDQIVMAPWRGTKAMREEAWSKMAQHSLEERLHWQQRSYGEAAIWDHEGLSLTPSRNENSACVPVPQEIPDWLFRAASPEPEPLPPLRPSGALGAADRNEAPKVRSRAKARLHGVLLHRLLEILPACPVLERGETFEHIVQVLAPTLPQGERDRLYAETLSILDNPELAPLFGPFSRAEADIAGEVVVAGKSIAVTGRIDRFAMESDMLWLADFKSGTRRQTHIVQLALYSALLRQIFPEKTLRAFLISPFEGGVEEYSLSFLEKTLARLVLPDTFT